jgi:hypothetical protein
LPATINCWREPGRRGRRRQESIKREFPPGERLKYRIIELPDKEAEEAANGRPRAT